MEFFIQIPPAWLADRSDTRWGGVCYNMGVPEGSTHVRVPSLADRIAHLMAAPEGSRDPVAAGLVVGAQATELSALQKEIVELRR